MKFLKGMIKKVTDSVNGLLYVARHELSFRLELLGLVFLLAFIYFFHGMLESIEILALILVYGLILVAEMGNTALEVSLERLHPERHELIGIAKDIAAGSVMLTFGLFTLVLAYVIFV